MASTLTLEIFILVKKNSNKGETSLKRLIPVTAKAFLNQYCRITMGLYYVCCFPVINASPTIFSYVINKQIILRTSYYVISIFHKLRFTSLVGI